MGHPDYAQHIRIPSTKINMGCHESSLREPLQVRLCPVGHREGDIRDYFDNADHAELLARLAPEDSVYVRRMLKAPVLDPEEGLLASTRVHRRGAYAKLCIRWNSESGACEYVH